MAPLSLTTHEDGDSIRLALSGELDMSSALKLEEKLRRIEQEAPDLLVLDLSTLKFVDSSGMRLIVSAHARARRSGRRLAIVEGPGAVKRIFRLTGLEERLDIVEPGV